MKHMSTFVIALVALSRSVLAQNTVVDVEEIRQSVTNTSKFSQVVGDASVDSRLKELAEKEKNLETRLTSPENVAAKEDAKSAPAVQEVKQEPTEAKAEVKPAEVKKVEAEPKKEIKKEEQPAAPIVKAQAAIPESEKALSAARLQIARLSKELDETKSRLMIAETEVERLNASMEQRNRDSLKAMNITSPSAPRARINTAELMPLQQDDEAQVIGDKMTAAIPVATVIVEKLSLKVGPTSSSSTLMQVSEGARLPIEGSQGSWYRVVAPTGARAWIPAAGVTIGGR